MYLVYRMRVTSPPQWDPHVLREESNEQLALMTACIVCLVTLKIGKTIPKKSTGYQIYFLIIFILRTD
jgi:hypothetical protein